MEFSETYLGQLRQLVGSRLLMVVGGRAVLENSDGKILLHKRSDFSIWAFPGGGAEEGESVEECIVREVFEETGLRMKHYEAIGFASNPNYETVIYPNGDITHNYCLILYTQEWEGELDASDPETKELGFFDPLELPEMPENERRTVDKYLEWKRSGKFQLY